MKIDAYDLIWDFGARVARAMRRFGIPGVERLLEQVGTRLIPVPQTDVEVTIADALHLLIPAGLPSSRTYARGAYEIPVTRLVRRLVRPRMTVIDVGAFCGYYTLLCSELVGSTGMVYAFEPHPATYGYLASNVERNGRRNVVTSALAVTATSGRGSLVLHRWPDHHWIALTGRPARRAPLNGTVWTETASGETASVEVATTALDDFFRARGWPRVDLIKIDVDGAEHAVLQGMRHLSSLNPHLRVIMEFDERNLRRAGTGWGEVAKTLRDLGFDTARVIERNLKRAPISERPPAGTICNLLLTRD